MLIHHREFQWLCQTHYLLRCSNGGVYVRGLFSEPTNICAWSMYAGMSKHQHTALQQENNWLVLGYVKTCDIPRYLWYIQVYTMYEQSEHKSKMCIQFFQIWREHDVVCMWAVCVNVQTLENHPEMQNIIACIYIYMHCISRHALSQTCIYMYMRIHRCMYVFM